MSRKLSQPYDLVIVGSGVAGLYGALCAAAESHVLLVSKGPVLTSSSWLAQMSAASTRIRTRSFTSCTETAARDKSCRAFNQSRRSR